MMISPESYYEEYLRGKTKEQIMSAIRGLKQEMGRLRNTMESPDYGQQVIIHPSEDTRLHWTREYLERAKQAYAEAGPIIESNPPDELKYGTNVSKIEKGMVVSFLEAKLEKVIPRADTFVTDMNIRLQFKEITYETLHDESFIKNLQKAYPYANLPKVPVDEATAVTSISFD